MEKIKDIIIIGSGPCGIYAGFCAGLRNMTGYLLEIKNEFGGQPLVLYRNKNVYDFPGIKKATGQEIVDMLWDQYKSQKNKIIPLSSITISHIIETEDYIEIVCVNGETLFAKTLLVAAGNGGMLPRIINLENEEHFLNIDYFVLDEKKYKNKKIVILGGGDSAVDWSNHFINNNISTDVTIIHRRSNFRAKHSNVEEMTKNNVRVLKNYNVEQLIGENNKCFQLLVKNNDSLKDELVDLDYLIVQYGLTNSYGLLSTIPDLKWEKGKILVGTNQQSSKTNIFAAGNVCQYEGKDYILSTSLGEAATAISNIYKKINPGYKGIFYSSVAATKQNT